MNCSIDGYILAGGLSSRMGRPKADIVLGDKTLLERALATMTEFTGAAPTVVVRSRSHINFQVPDGIETIEDDANDGDPRAPIFGVRAAVRHSEKEWIAILAVDLPFVTVELFGKLAEVRRDGTDAVLAVHRDGTPQVMCGLYRCAPMITAIEQGLERGDYSVRGALPRGRTEFLECSPTDNGLDPLSNLNTEEDLRAAERILSRMPLSTNIE